MLGIRMLMFQIWFLFACSSYRISRPPTRSGNVRLRMSDALADGFFRASRAFSRSGRPPHIGVPRRRLELKFAVQLMRSSYNTVDELDFCAMDDFQKKFFLFRQSEWEDYKSNHATVTQGDLADALYFDFISYCQYAVINQKMRDGKLEFVEQFDANGKTRIVRRDPSVEDNSLLPGLHSQMVGDKILRLN